MTRALIVLLSVVSLAPLAYANVGAREDSSNNARAASRARLSDAALTRADKLLAQLARLDATSFAAGQNDTKRAAHKASEIFSRAQALPEGDLKVDLATAARLYERAFARRLMTTDDAASSISCADERPGAYRSLCARQSPRDAIALMVGKARRHVEWARASVAEERGDAGPSAVVLEEMRAERVLDLVCARQALDALSELEALTADAPATLADYEDEKKIGKVSAAEFGARFDASAQVVGRALAWLPESQVKTEIDNAWQSYADALWWWERGEHTSVVRVTNNKFTGQNFAAMAHVAETQLGYNAVINFRHAHEYTRRAESLAAAELSRAGFTTGN
jgi:hypothetical protein